VSISKNIGMASRAAALLGGTFIERAGYRHGRCDNQQGSAARSRRRDTRSSAGLTESAGGHDPIDNPVAADAAESSCSPPCEGAR
jgi:hypothetical protein